MAEQEQDRSETATPFKLQEAKKRGQVPKSLELNSFFALAAMLLVMFLWGRGIVQDHFRLDARVLAMAGQIDFSPPVMQYWLAEVLRQMLHGIAPLLVVLAVIAIGANFLQTGPIWTTFPLKPDIDRVNPISGFKRLFSWRLVFELAKNLVKLAAFSVILYLIVRDLLPVLMALPQADPRSYLETTFVHALWIVFKLLAALLVIALIDVLYTRWQFNDKQKMSRREVREEVKHREGDPRIRARMKELRRETLARSEALRRLPEADVLITNPTHLAVALLYQADKMGAPEVIAKGGGEMAEQMKALARRHRVPIVENRTLARALFARTGVDQKIPDEYFAPVAKLLVWVYALRDRAAANCAPQGAGNRSGGGAANDGARGFGAAASGSRR